MNYLTIDIETDFAWRKIDMVGLRSTLGETFICTSPSELTGIIDVLKEIDDITLITWNGQRFDLPLLKRCWGVDLTGMKHLDGMLLHKLMHHGVKVGHSLAAVAKRFFPVDPTRHKAEIDFKECTKEELAVYCLQDLKVTWDVVRHMLISEMYCKNKENWKRALLLEQKVAGLVDQQVQEEVFFDLDLAGAVHKKIGKRMASIEAEVNPGLPRVPLSESKIKHPPKVQFKKDGDLSVAIRSYCNTQNYELVKKADAWFAINGAKRDSRRLPLTKPFVVDKRLVLSDQEDLKRHLLTQGWTPTEWNFKYDKVTGRKINTSPRLTNKITKEPCPDLDRIGIKYISLVSEWLMLRSRKNIMLSDKGTGWIAQAEASATSSIPSDADSMGANTARWTHKGIANVPRVTSPYGREIRNCFRARPGKVWVGWDASALEARVEAHYCYPHDPEYALELVEGDVHTRNMEALGLPDRDTAKTFKYAITYGSQAATLSKTLRCTVAEAQVVYDKFWDANPALKKLKSDLKKEWMLNDKIYITALDGRKIWCRSEHSLVNALFQSAGAIIMKYAMLIANYRIKGTFPDYKELELPKGLIRYHDEEIWECEAGIESRLVGELGARSVVEAGEALKLNVALDAEFKVGQSWADVH